MRKSRSWFVVLAAPAIAAAGCGAVPDALKADLKETAQAAAQDTAKELIQDVADYVLEEVLDTGFDLPLDLDSNGLEFAPVTIADDEVEE